MLRPRRPNHKNHDSRNVQLSPRPRRKNPVPTGIVDLNLLLLLALLATVLRVANMFFFLVDYLLWNMMGYECV
jgi:hypothetical protein